MVACPGKRGQMARHQFEQHQTAKAAQNRAHRKNLPVFCTMQRHQMTADGAASQIAPMSPNFDCDQVRRKTVRYAGARTRREINDLGGEIKSQST